MPYKDLATHRAHSRWSSMIARCANPAHKQWKDYGGRGITVCNRWLDFKAFYADVGDAPHGMSLDRIDNDDPLPPWSPVRNATQGKYRRQRQLSGESSCST